MPTVQESIADFVKLQDDVNDTSVNFLHASLATAMTMARIAVAAPGGSEKEKRNLQSARRAYEMVRRWHRKVALTAAERKDLDQKLYELQLALESLGECF